MFLKINKIFDNKWEYDRKIQLATRAKGG